MSLRNIGTSRRPIGEPVAPEPAHIAFAIPPSSDVTDLNLPLLAVAREVDKRIQKYNKLVFHTVGDTGDINNTGAQLQVAEAMEKQLNEAADQDKPGFFYHLGDVVYYNGMPTHYDEQFYEPYKHYQAVIFAIAGNHDGAVRTQGDDEKDPFPTLAGFMENFCQTHSAFGAHGRDTMTQPYVWWTLDTPVASIIGLYSNIAGSLDGTGSFEQQNWLQNELRRVPKEKPLLVAVHHPPYSLDTAHGGSPHVGQALDDAMEATGRIPDAIFSGHVHSYQRFTRNYKNREIPYIVAGAGGFGGTPKAIHKVQKENGKQLVLPYQTLKNDVILSNFQDQTPGFLRITIDAAANTLTGEYFSVPFEAEDGAHKLFETFVLNLKTHKVN